jgi:large subunit ribosomal protein L21
MFAVVVVGTKQFNVSPGAVLEVEKIDGAVGDTVTLDNVLMLEDKGKVTVGKPHVAGTKVKAKILTQGKGKKVDVSRYKSKVRRRKHIGFRPHITKLEILSIG